MEKELHTRSSSGAEITLTFDNENRYNPFAVKLDKLTVIPFQDYKEALEFYKHPYGMIDYIKQPVVLAGSNAVERIGQYV